MNKYIKLKQHIVFYMYRKYREYSGMDETDFILNMQNVHDKLVDDIWDCFETNNRWFSIRMIEKFTDFLNTEYNKTISIYRGEK